MTQISCSRDLVICLERIGKGRACASSVCDSTDVRGFFQRLGHETLQFPEPEPEDLDGGSSSSEEEEFVEADHAMGIIMPLHVAAEGDERCDDVFIYSFHSLSLIHI